MRLFSDIWFRIRALVGARRMDQDFADEASFHLEMETQENIQNGMHPVEARRKAQIAFGGVERFREKARDARGVRPFEDLTKDIRHTLRGLRRAKGFSLVAVLSLAVVLLRSVP